MFHRVNRFAIVPLLAIASIAFQQRQSPQVPIDAGCTVVYATDGERTLGGNNEDYSNPLTRIWFVPGEDGNYGRAYVGYENFFPQGGMNDQGLFFDGLAVDRAVDVPRGDKEALGTALVDRIMRECASIDCVIAYFDTYHLADTWHFQLMFGDAARNAVIVEPLTMIRMEGNYQVATNFYQSETALESCECERYRTATRMLEKADTLSVEFMRDVMDAVHVTGKTSTLYTTVYDLKQQVIYLYYFHDYEHVVTFDLEEELGQGLHAYEIGRLFPENPAAQRWARPLLDRYEQLVEARIDRSLSPDTFEAYRGTYLMPDDMWFGGGNVSIVPDGLRLWMVFPGGRQYEFLPRAEASFFNIGFQGEGFDLQFELTFDRDEQGIATRLQVSYGDSTYTCERQSGDVLSNFVPLLRQEQPDREDDRATAPEPTVTPTRPASPTPGASVPEQPIMTATVRSPDELPPEEDPAGNALAIAGIAGAVILIGGAGLFFVLRTRRL